MAGRLLGLWPACEAGDDNSPGSSGGVAAGVVAAGVMAGVVAVVVVIVRVTGPFFASN